jgi:tRNA uridine 5-carbamoylmethylation protein Kti12
MKQETRLEDETEYKIALLVMEVLKFERERGQKIELSMIQELLKEFEEAHPQESNE